MWNRVLMKLIVAVFVKTFKVRCCVYKCVTLSPILKQPTTCTEFLLFVLTF
jgi:hypothetical protein